MMLQVPQVMSLRGLGDCCVVTTDPDSGDTVTDCSGCASEPVSTPTPTTPSSSSGGLTPAQIAAMISAGGTAAAAAFAGINAPPGYVYNPATNQYVRAGAMTAPPAGFMYNPSTGQYVASSSVSVSGVMPLVIGGVALIALMLVLKK